LLYCSALVAKPAFQCSWVKACTSLDTQVDLLFYLFSDGQDNLNIRYFYEVMNRHITTGLNMACEFVRSARWCSSWRSTKITYAHLSAQPCRQPFSQTT
jgi:hypothetical protein